MAKEVIGIDLGGTTIKVGRVGNEKIEEIAVSPTPKTDDPMVVVDAIVETISKIVTDNTSAIGIGIPSVVDVEKGIVYDVMNIPSWKEVPIKSLLEERYGGRSVQLPSAHKMQQYMATLSDQGH